MTIKTILIIILISMLAGFLINELLFLRKTQTLPVVYSPLQTLYKIDTLKTVDTLIRNKIDTLIINDTVSIGKIPWRFQENTDSLSFNINNKEYRIPFVIKHWFKGMNGGYEITTMPRLYTFDYGEEKRNLIQPYISVDINYCFLNSNGMDFKSGIEMGLAIKPFSFYLRTDYYKYYKQIIPQGGIKWEKKW